MSFWDELLDSLVLIFQSGEVWNIATLSIFVSTTAVLISSVIGIPIGVALGSKKEKSKLLPISLLNTGMALPPVVVGLVVFLLLARQGPLGFFNILFTPLAMIIAQAILTLPIIIGITRSTIRDLPDDLHETLRSMGATPGQARWEVINEAKSGMMIAIIVALGRAFSEVGAIIIVGGNIRYHTRVLTTSIITEIGKGDRPMALALGILLMTISFSLTSIATYLQLNSSED